MRKSLFASASSLLLLLLPACGPGSGSRGAGAPLSGGGDTITLSFARNLTMVEHDGFTQVDIRNPWDTTRMLHRYILLEKGAKEPAETGDATILRIPLEHPVVYSAVHTAMIAELGHEQAIAGVCDTDYLFDPGIIRKVKSGEIADCGGSMSPDLERIFSLAPDAVMLSPYENNRDYSKLERGGISVIECADYMEASPLGRAEWMKFYGRLFGEGSRADSIFAAISREYLSLKERAAAAGNRPSVIFDRIYSGVWYVPEKYSTTGRFIEDAGGSNPFADGEKTGSIPMPPEKAFMQGGEADFWLIRHAGEDISYPILQRDNPMYGKLKAFRNRKIFLSDTSRTRIFEESAFHPQWLLADMISILHPEIGVKPTHRYYVPMRE